MYLGCSSKTSLQMDSINITGQVIMCSPHKVHIIGLYLSLYVLWNLLSVLYIQQHNY